MAGAARRKPCPSVNPARLRGHGGGDLASRRGADGTPQGFVAVRFFKGSFHRTRQG